MSDEKIWELSIDGTSALATLDDIDAAFSALADKVSQTATSAVDLSVFDDILTAIGELTATVSDGFDSLDTSIQAVDTSVMQAVGELETLAEAASSVTTAEAEMADGADTAASQFSLLGAAGDAVSGALDGLQAASGPLMMLSAAAIMGGKSMFDMGTQAQDSLSIVQGMAGATDQDIQNLEQSALELGVNMKDAGDGMYFVASAGYSGKDGITVLDNSIKAAKASGSQMSDVANGLTAVLHAYGLTAQDSGAVTDEMVETVVQGKQSFSDFASSIGPLAATASTVGVSFNQMVAAEATMTQINPHVKQDANELSFLMTAVAGNIDKTADTAKGLGIAFDKNAYSSLDFMGKLQYLQQQSGGNITAFTKLTGGTSGFKAAMDILNNSGDTYRQNLLKIENSQGATDKAFGTSEQTVSAHLDKMGASFSLFSTKVVEALGPKIIPIIDNISKVIGNVMDAVINHTSTVMPILAGLAAIIGGAVVGAIVALVISMAPVLLALLAIGAAVAGTVYAFQHWSDIVRTVQSVLQNPIISTIIHYFQEIGAYLASVFVPIWQQLVSVWQSQILPVIQQLGSVFQMLIPVFQVVGAIVGAVVGVVIIGAIMLLVGVINGIAKALTPVIGGFAQVFGGVVQVISGVVQVVGSILRVIYDLFTGNFGHIGADLKMFASGVVSIFTGLGNMIAGIWNAVFGGIASFVSGFISGVIGFFQHLADILVGHSIIPDMLNAIIGVFAALPGAVFAVIAAIPGMIGALFSSAFGIVQNAWSGAVDFFNNIWSGIMDVFSAVGSFFSDGFNNAVSGIQTAIAIVPGIFSGLWDDITGGFNNLISGALSWGSNLINGFVNGIKGAIGAVTNAVGSVVDTVKNFLGFGSPTKLGPGSTLMSWGPGLIKGFVDGMHNAMPDLHAAVGQAAQTISGLQIGSPILPNVSPPSGASISFSTPGATQTDYLLAQILTELQQARQGREAKSTTIHNSLSIQTANDNQKLSSAIQALGGYSYEVTQRGAY